MSGHSKWANIRVKKTAQDAKRGKVFTRHARLIEIAARVGGGDPISNAALRVAIDNAREENVPNMNIERAIKKGTGEVKGEAMQEVLYAAYGPGGVACLIECLTDNRNRTTANLKIIIGRHGGNFAETGSVQWMFERKGVVVGSLEGRGKGKEESARLPDGQGKLDEIELELIDFGAEDFSVEDNVIHVITSAHNWQKVRDFLKQKGCEILSAGLSFIAKQKMQVVDPAVVAKLESFVEAVEEDEDVSEVHTNAAISQ